MRNAWTRYSQYTYVDYPIGYAFYIKVDEQFPHYTYEDTLVILNESGMSGA